jgi:hypothetical protein
VRDTYIFDLDGTLALIDHRRHWLDDVQHPDLDSDARWREFYAHCPEDQPNVPVIKILQVLQTCEANYRVIIFSGRSDEVKEQTLKWLWDNNIDYDEIYMRQAGDYRADVDLKREFLNEKVDRTRIMAVFDDRDSVVQMWREEGLPCFQVAPGDF